MAHLLSYLSIFMAVMAALTPLLPGLFPRIGLMPIYRMRPVRVVLIIAAWGVAIAAGMSEPASFVGLPFVFIFSIPAIVMEPQRIFVSLDDPEHVPASEASIGGEALVLGYDGGDHAAVWPFETLAPRHLINDQIADAPLLVAY